MQTFVLKEINVFIKRRQKMNAIFPSVCPSWVIGHQISGWDQCGNIERVVWTVRAERKGIINADEVKRPLTWLHGQRVPSRQPARFHLLLLRMGLLIWNRTVYLMNYKQPLLEHTWIGLQLSSPTAISNHRTWGGRVILEERTWNNKLNYLCLSADLLTYQPILRLIVHKYEGGRRSK